MEKATKSARLRLRISNSLRKTLVPLQNELLTIGLDMCTDETVYDGDVDWFDTKCESLRIPIQSEDILFAFSRKVQLLYSKTESQDTERCRILAFKSFIETNYPALADRIT